MMKSHFLLFITLLASSLGSARNDSFSKQKFVTFHQAFESSRAEPRGDNEPSATDSILRYWLSPQIVNSEKPVANTFYFWTSTRELDSVISQQRLLRTISPMDPLASLYLENLIRKGVNKDEEIANHLFSCSRQRIRTAWPNYWSTLTEYVADSLNNQLVQVVLMDSALIVKFSPDENQKQQWTIFDLKGTIIPMDAALKRTRHIAVVFFEGKRNTTYVAPRPLHIKDYYRTFILCNEDMIKSWHHGVPGMQAKIIHDLDYLLLMNSFFNDRWLLSSQGKKGKIAYASWKMPQSEMKMNNYFFATQRFAWMTGVDASSNSAAKIISLLRMRWPKQVNPCERYPGKK